MPRWLPLILPALLALTGCFSDAVVDPETHGLLTIVSSPPGAEIVVDGQDSYAKTPYTFLEMPTGTHDIHLELFDYETSVSRILLSAGEHVRLNSVLSPIYAKDDDFQRLLDQVTTAFAGHDTAGYARLLGPGFVFLLRTEDVRAGLPDTLDRADELRFAAGLFSRGSAAMKPARDLMLTLQVLSTSADGRPGHAGWKDYQVRARLTATYDGASTLSLDSPGRLTLGRSASDELILLQEWDDQGPSTPTAPGPAPGNPPQSFGQLRARYQ